MSWLVHSDKKGNKRYTVGKEENKLSLFTDDIGIYMESPKELTKKLLKLSSYSRFAEYKDNIKMSVTILSTCNVQAEIKHKKILFTMTPFKMKYLGVTLTKFIQNPFERNYKTLMNKVKEELNKWRDIACSWIGRLNIVKMSLLPNLICRLSAIPVKIQASILWLSTNIKFIWRCKNTPELVEY